MRGLVLVAGLTLFGCLPVGSAAADDNQNLVALCIGSDKDRAIPACTDLINGASLSNSDKAAIFTYRAVAYLSKAKYDLAIGDTGRAIDISPDFAGALRCVRSLT